MYKSKPSGYSYTYSELIIKAGQAVGVSPYHIASRIKQEVGSSLSSVTNGKHATYPGIYNFYNIGGYDSASGNAVTNALRGQRPAVPTEDHGTMSTSPFMAAHSISATTTF